MRALAVTRHPHSWALLPPSLHHSRRQRWERSCRESACLSHVYRAWSFPAINTHGCQRDKIITLLVGFQEKCGPKFPCSTHQRNFIEFKITILPSETDLALNHNSSVVGTLQFKSFPQQGNKSFKKYIKISIDYSKQKCCIQSYKSLF